jgi:hypothetical protein
MRPLMRTRLPTRSTARSRSCERKRRHHSGGHRSSIWEHELAVIGVVSICSVWYILKAKRNVLWNRDELECALCGVVHVPEQRRAVEESVQQAPSAKSMTSSSRTPHLSVYSKCTRIGHSQPAPSSPPSTLCRVCARSSRAAARMHP